MPTGNMRLVGDVGGIGISGSVVKTNSGQIGQQTTLAVAKTGTLSTRTNDTDGTLTMAASHGITTAAVIDLYWSGGRRYNVVVGTVSVNSVPISGGAGDNLPIATTAITAQVQNVIDVDFAGSLATMIAAKSVNKGMLLFYESTTLRAAIDLAADEPWFYSSTGGFTSPLLTYAISSIKVTQSSSSSTSVFSLGVLYDSD